MRFDTYFINQSSDKSILTKLFENDMYSSGGVLKSVYRGLKFSPKSLIISTLSIDDKFASVMALPEKEYYWWDYSFPVMREAYGMIGFYTKPEYRGNGYSRLVFENFDKTHKIRKLTAHSRCRSILKSVHPSDLIIIPN